MRYGICAALMLAIQGTTASAAGEMPVGAWSNPKNSVHIRVDPCGKAMCGTVIWASEKAKAKARKGGTANLVGTQLFREFHRDGKGIWRGKVYVPDIDMTLTGSITVVDDNTITGRGCLIGPIGCKSQTWKRIS